MVGSKVWLRAALFLVASIPLSQCKGTDLSDDGGNYVGQLETPTNTTVPAPPAPAGESPNDGASGRA